MQLDVLEFRLFSGVQGVDGNIRNEYVIELDEGDISPASLARMWNVGATYVLTVSLHCKCDQRVP